MEALYCLNSYFFFFSSRRRHTRSDRDWSSDVCSSDLVGDVAYASLGLPKKRTVVTYQDAVSLHRYSGLKRRILLEYFYRRPIQRAGEIGRASCRERV